MDVPELGSSQYRAHDNVIRFAFLTLPRILHYVSGNLQPSMHGHGVLLVRLLLGCEGGRYVCTGVQEHT